MYSRCIAFFRHQITREQIRDDGGCEQQDAMSRYCANLTSATTTRIDTYDTNQVSVLLSMTMRAIGCRYFLRPSYDKAVTGQQYRKYDIPGRLDSRSNPRLVGVFSLPFPSNARALYRGFTVAWSQSHENWVAPRAYRRTRCAIVQPFEAPFQSGDLAIYRARSSVGKIAVRFCHRCANCSFDVTVVRLVIVLSGIWMLTAFNSLFCVGKKYTCIYISHLFEIREKIIYYKIVS